MNAKLFNKLTNFIEKNSEIEKITMSLKMGSLIKFNVIEEIIIDGTILFINDSKITQMEISCCVLNLKDGSSVLFS